MGTSTPKTKTYTWWSPPSAHSRPPVPVEEAPEDGPAAPPPVPPPGDPLEGATTALTRLKSTPR